MQRQRALAAQQPEERRRELDARQRARLERRVAPHVVLQRGAGCVVRLRALDLARRKAERQRIAKADAPRDDLARPARRVARRIVLREPGLEQPHRLKELEAMRLIEQPLDYARIDSPLRGLHRMISSPVRLDTTIS